MAIKTNWIWLNDKMFPEYQNSYNTIYANNKNEYNYCVCEFARALILNKTAVAFKIYIAAETKYHLWINGEYIGDGPVYAGGDNSSDLKMDKSYFTEYLVKPTKNRLNINVLVRKDPIYGCESTKGKPGLAFLCEIVYDDGLIEKIRSDDKWDVRIRKCFVNELFTDYTKVDDNWTKAKIVDMDSILLPSPIPPMQEENIKSTVTDMMICPPKVEAIFEIPFDKIYSGNVCFTCDGGDYEINVGTSETQDDVQSLERIKARGHLDFRSLNFQSIGIVVLNIKNLGKEDVKIENVHLKYIHYPITKKAFFNTSDEEINEIYDLCVHNLSICRQTLHLDSPMHKEPLGCVGDYYIEALMEYFVFGETKLTRFDITRIGDYLRLNDGKMFHTTYSLIWLYMVWDYYMFTGDTSIFEETKEARLKLDKIFLSYLGSDGVIEKAPNFMFVDWINIDGFSLHHPPKALGQAVLTAFYIHFLDIMAKISELYDELKNTQQYQKRAHQARRAFNDRFFDLGKNIYKAGLGNVSKVPVGEWMPQNVNKKYFIRHPNILSVLYDICPNDIMESIAVKMITNPDYGPIQPYFMHFMLDMIWKMGMFDEYGIETIKKWGIMLSKTPKGLAEGWGDFKGDFSHAWGGTPAYQLPRAFLGFEMVKPGFKEIKLNPKSFGLDYVHVSLPTPFGDIELEMRKGSDYKLVVPEKIKYTVESKDEFY